MQLMTRFSFLNEVKIHVTKKQTGTQLLGIIVATPTIGSVIQESNPSKNCLESHETKIQANTTRLLPSLSGKLCLRVQTERADRLGALDLKRWKRPQSFCHRLHLVRDGGGAVCARNNEVHGAKQLLHGLSLRVGG